MVSTLEVTPVCPAYLNPPGTLPCSGSSSSPVNEFIEVQFTRTYNLCPTGCTSWKASYSLCCRDNSLTNVDVSSGPGLYTELTIQPTFFFNESPQIFDPSVVYLEAGKQARISAASFDVHGDSLTYALTNCYDEMGIPLTYQPGFSASQPMWPQWKLEIDDITGDLIFIPLPGAAMTATVCLEINEYRFGNLMGTYHREIYVVATNPPASVSSLPYIPPFGAPFIGYGVYQDSFVIESRIGQQLYLPIQAFDNDVNDTVIMSWSNNIPGASFSNPAGNTFNTITGVNPEAVFSWTPTSAGRFSFRVALENTDCTVFTSHSDYTFVISVDTCELTADLGPDVAICPGDTAHLQPTLTGNNPWMFYQWMAPSPLPNPSSPDIFASDPGLYILTVIDTFGCIAIDSINVLQTPTPPISFSGSTDACKGDTFSFTVSAPANPPTTITIVGFDGATIISGTGAGPYEVIWPSGGTKHITMAIATPNCSWMDSVAIPVSEDCVWPGDADNDGIANNFDLLAVGLAFSSTGPPRLNASLNWDAQYATPWANNLPNGANYVHTDTDGNGIVNADDTLAINQNYGLTHNKTGTTHGDNDDPPLLFLPQTDTVAVADTLRLPIVLGLDSVPADSVYGLAFTINYNATLVDSASAHISFDNSWMGTSGVDLLSISKDFYAQGKLDAALTRTDQQSVNGFGTIAYFSIVMVDDIAGKDEVYETLNMNFSDVRLIGLQGQEIPVNASAIEITVGKNTTAVSPYLSRLWKVYPQPADQQFYIESAVHEKLMIEITNLSGQQLLRQSQIGHRISVSVADLPKGIYLLTVSNVRGKMVRKIMVR